MKIRNLTISNMLTWSLVLMATLVIVSLLVITFKLIEVRDRVEEMANLHARQVQLSSDLIIGAQDRVQLIKNVLLIKNPNEVREEFYKFVDAREKFYKTSALLTQILDKDQQSSAAERNLLNQIKILDGQFVEDENDILNLGLVGQYNQGVELYNHQARPLFLKWRADMDQLLQIELKLNHDAALEVQNLQQNVFATMLFIGLLVVLATVFLIQYFRLKIVHPLAKFDENLLCLTENKLDFSVNEILLNNEIGLIARSIDKLKNELVHRGEEKWVKANLAELITDLHMANTYQNLVDCLVLKLGHLLNTAQMVYYVARKNDSKLVAIASFGGAKLNTEYQPGEGLVGQVAKEKTSLYIDIPASSRLQWMSGLLTGLPQQIAILPILHHGELLAVLELGLNQPMNAVENQLMDELIKSIAPILEVQRRTQETTMLVSELQEKSVALSINQQEILKTQRELSQNNSLLNGVLTAATSIAIISTDEQGTITTFNKGAELMFGQTAEQVIGQQVSTNFFLIVGIENSDFFELVGYATTHGSDVREIRFKSNDDSTNIAEVHINLIIATDQVSGYLFVVRDVTKDREVEIAMSEARRAAEEVARQKSEFLANMSHEIRTPMNAIIGMTYLVQKTELTARQSEYLKKIQRSSQHLLGIINDILDISKIEAGMLRIEQSHFELESVLANVFNLIGAKAEEKGLQLELDISHDVPVELIGDSLRLGQILTNYCSNALKFTERGEIAIKVRVVERDENTVLLNFAVRDTGIGLSDEQKNKLFIAFSQADASTTRKYGGTGLGLVISKNLAEQMGGNVGLDSEIGVGSTFWFTARLGIGHPEHEKLIPSPDLRGRHVLVVDDNDNAREIMSELFKSMSMDVEAVASGKEAIEAVKVADTSRRPFELVLMDWHMPLMNGIEALRKIRALPLAEPPQLMLVTAYGREEVFSQAQDTGISDVLVKPFSASTLFDSTMRALHHHVGDEIRMSATNDIDLLQELSSIAGARLLLVEDNELNQEVALEILHQARFVVDLAENGRIALNRLQERPYDLVLMDMQMPVMDGLEATQQIRKIPELKHLPVVAMTANALAEDRQRCMDAGMNDFLSKPIDPDHLWQTLLKWIPARQATVPAVVSAAVNGPSSTFKLDVAGIESGPALRRMLGRVDLYVNTARKFCNNRSNVVELINKSLDVDDWVSAQRHAHTLKGTSATIGAMELSKLAGSLEQALKERQSRDVVNLLIVPIAETLEKIVAELQLQLPPEPAAEKPIDVTDGEIALKELEKLLIESNPDAMSYMENNMAALRLVFSSPRLTEIEAAVRQFDLMEALRIFQEAKNNMENNKS